jgi:N-acetylneuraminic acid mutarotase
MSNRPFLPTVLALGSCALISCAQDTTQPNPPANEAAGSPELAVTSGTWLKQADIPGEARRGIAMAAVTNAAGQSVLYVIGGCTVQGGYGRRTVSAYNVATNTWTRRASLPLLRCKTNGAGVIDGKIYVTGGNEYWEDKSESATVYMYDPGSNKWTPKANMPDRGHGGVTAVIKRKLYVYTECDDSKVCDHASALDRYDPDTDQWTSLAELALHGSSHQFGVGGAIDGKFYLVGGTSRELHVYDPGTNQWTASEAPFERRYEAGGAVLGGKLYVIGGVAPPILAPEGPNFRQTDLYNPATNSWSVGAPLPTDRSSVAASKVFINGRSRIEVVGGSRPGNNLQYAP